MHPLTLSFVLVLAAMVAIRWWLATRQLAALARHRDSVPAAFAASVTLADHRRAADYGSARLRLGRLELLNDALLLLWLTLAGGLAWCEQLAARAFAAPLTRGVATLLLLGFALALVSLPWQLWSTFHIESRYGFNRTTPKLFAADLARSWLLGLVLGAPLAALVLWLMAAAGARWWLWAWAVWVAFSLLLSVAWPRLIAPLYNRFRPLEAGALRAAVEGVLARCGYRADGVFVMDGSRRSSHGNAYFTGLGKSRRIVLFDTLLERLEPLEIEAVLAHELGHYRLHHIRNGLVLSFAFALAGFALLGYAASNAALYPALGVPRPSTAAALALFVLVTPVFMFPFAPLASWWSRRHEYQADRYAAAHSDAAALARALVRLYRDNAATLTPDRLYSAWHDSHPPALARIAALTTATE